MSAPHNKVGVKSAREMETRFVWNGVIRKLIVIFLLLQATSSQNATNSTVNSLTSKNSSTITNSTTLVISLNSTETLEASKKDKRQAQRGYTDIPLDERSFDEVANSSPPPFVEFESDRPPPALTNNDISSSSSSGYLPSLDRKPDSSFFSPRLGFPSNLPKLDEVPAATTIIERRDDFFDTSGDGKPIPGEAGRDYPTFSSIPRTSFSCKDQAWPGYYADTEARCQVFWICQKQRMDAFLCPNGTLFNQQVFVCDWWFNVDCNTAPEFYSRNQFLYAGPGVGIDGQPTRGHKGLPPLGSSGAANSFVNSVVPRPNSNGFVNQVQSSNQVARVASIGQNQVLRQQSPPPPHPTSTGYNNNNQNNQNYLPVISSKQESQHQQQHQNYNQNQLQYTASQKYTSNQNMLSNRMQKNPTNPTDRPSSSTENSFTGGYQQQQQSNDNQYHQSPSNEVARRTYSSPEQNQVFVEYHTNRSVSTTQRPDVTTIHTPSSRPNTTPRLVNVNIEPKGGKQQAVITFSGTISSTARPVSINTEIPSYNHGSSTLQTPKDFGHPNQFNNHQQQGRQNNGYQQDVNHQRTTSAPITTTFRSTSTTYSSVMRVVPQTQHIHPQPSPNPNNVGNRQVGSIGSLQPPSPTTSPSPVNIFDQSNSINLGQAGFVPPTQITPTLITSTLRPPGLDLDSQRYVDRFGFVQSTQPNNNRNFVSSTTPQPLGFSSTEKAANLHLGQRSNQYTNYNGQREIMYSPSTINANIEYPYSPSQQKNKQKRLELESLKSFRTQGKDLFAYPHFHGQRSNAYSDADRSRDDNKINVDFSTQVPPETRPYHQLPGENVHHPSNQFPGIRQTIITHPVSQTQNHNHQQQINHSTPSPNQIQHPNHNPNFIPPPTAHTLQNNFVTSSPNFHQAQQQNTHQQGHFGSHSTSSNIHQNQQQIQHHPQQGHGQPNSQNAHHIPVRSEDSNNNQRPPQQIHQQFQQQQQPQQHAQPQPNHQFHKQTQPQQNFHQVASQSQPQSHHHHTQNAPPNHQHFQNQQHQLSPSASPSTPFHQRIIQIPSQNLQLPSSSQDHFRDGFTSLKSGSFISIATTASPAFSRQILSHQQQPSKATNSIANNIFPSPTPPPNGLNYLASPTPRQQKQQQGQISSTMRPPPPHSTAPSFTNDHFVAFHKDSSPSKATPTPFTNQNSFIAAPTQSSVSSTSPGHRQNSYLPHNHGKRNKQPSNTKKQHHEGQRSNQESQHRNIQYPANSAITTTIKYPEGTGSLKVGVPGATSTKRLVDFSYSAHPKSNTTPFPTVTERFNNVVVSSTTRRPPSPQYNRESHRIVTPGGKRLAGAVLNKSTSSSSAIYVDTSAVAESVSTPVSVAPSPTAAPAVSTSNFGLRISTMAKKRMANAWQNYFGSGEKAGNSTQESNSA